MTQPTLSFFADDVGAETEDFDSAGVLYIVGFGTGDVETTGHSWNFSQAYDENWVASDDWGVCTVREIQRGVTHGGIERFRLHRSGAECVFDPKAADDVGVSALLITFEINDEAWAELTAIAEIVFRDCPYFHLER